MPFLNREGIHFHYLDRGNGVPLCFQHGLGGETEKIFSLLELPSGFRLLGLDCRAHGKTTPLGHPDNLRFDCLADDLIALMDHLNLAGLLLGGTSMGAGVALNCALRYPKRVLGLVLLRPAWLDSPNETTVRLMAEIAQLVRSHGAAKGLEHFRQSQTYLSMAQKSADSAESLLGLFSDPRAEETIARLELIPQDAPNRDRCQWRRIRIPTLVLATEGDPIHPFEFGQVLAREIPNARFQALPSKSAGLAQYTTQLHRCLAEFLQPHFL